MISQYLYIFTSQVPSNEPAQFFSFLNPLALEVWIYWLVAYVVVSVTLYVVARFSPYEWEDGKTFSVPDQETIPSNLNRFTLSNSFWFTIGSLMQQGSDISPKVWKILILWKNPPGLGDYTGCSLAVCVPGNNFLAIE